MIECKEGWHWSNCSQQCVHVGHCRSVTTCNHVTGLCDVGCEDGWYGIHFSQPCEGHYRGEKKTCSDVKMDCTMFIVVNRVNGNVKLIQPVITRQAIVTKNVKMGFIIEGHCKGGETCNHVTSLCDVGCADGWYGVKCTQQCKGHCRDN